MHQKQRQNFWRGKTELANSKELFELYRNFATIEEARFDTIHEAIKEADGVGGKIAEIKNQTNNFMRDSCPDGSHWEPALGDCVPN